MEDVGVKMARDTLNSGREEFEKEKEIKKRPYRVGQLHRRRCKKCNGLFHKEDLQDGFCFNCAPLRLPSKKINDNIPMKRCFFCESDSFHILKIGIIKCARCAAEFRREKE